MARLTGTAGNDTLRGTSANDTFVWSAGDDIIIGGGGSDRLDYTTFSLAITVDFGMTAYSGTVIKAGGNGTDTFTGIREIFGGSGNDTLFGSIDPTPNLPFGINMRGGAGNDTIDGRSSTLNLASYSDATSGVTINLKAGTASGGGVGTDTLINVRRAEGSNFNDTITGSDFNDLFNHSAGSDVYNGGAGFNTMSYARGATGFSVVVTATAPGIGIFNLPNLTIAKSDGGTDSLTGFNRVDGSGGSDTFIGAITNYSFLAYIFRGGAGNDTFNGQSSAVNRVDYSSASSAVTVDLEAGTAFAGADGNDTLINVRSIGASNFNDTLLGSSGNDTFRVGALGERFVDGRGGNNTISYGGAVGVTIDLGTTAAEGGFGGFSGTITKAAGTDIILNFANATGGAGNDTIYGSSANNFLGGSAGNNFIDGRGGSDTYTMRAFSGDMPTQGGTVNLGDGVSGTAINPWGGTDVLISIENARGSNFNDTITGAVNGALVSFISGEGGNDRLIAPTTGTFVTADYSSAISRVVVNLTTGLTTDDGMFGGTDTLVNIESVRGSGFGDLIFGNAAGNTITGRAGNDEIYGLDGDDTIFGDADADLVFGGNGADRIEGGTGADTLYGEAGNDILIGGTEADVLFGGAGVGILLGGDGDDVVVGGDDQDYLYGDAGGDYIYGGGGNDFIYGGTGVDYIYGDAGNDFIFGGADNDIILGGAGVDVLFGEDGVDVILGQGDADYIYGGNGNDYIFGQGGGDFLYGGQGNDFIYGDDGDDFIFGEEGVDYIFGGAGNDVLRGGGDLPDVFYHTAMMDGNDVVVDFQAGADVLVLFGTGYGSFAGAIAAAYFDGANTVFTTGIGTSMTVLNMTLNAFTPDTLVIA